MRLEDLKSLNSADERSRSGSPSPAKGKIKQDFKYEFKEGAKAKEDKSLSVTKAVVKRPMTSKPQPKATF